MAKKTNRTNTPRVFSEDLNNIRELVRLIVLFGCYTKNDLTTEYLFSVIHANDDLDNYTFGNRKLDDEKRRLKAIYPPRFLNTRKKGRKDILFITPDMYERQDDTLMRLFRYRSFRDNEIFMYFFLMQWFAMDKAVNEEGSTLRGISFSLYDLYNANNNDWQDIPDSYILKDHIRNIPSVIARNLPQKEKEDRILKAVSDRIRPHIEALVDAGYLQEQKADDKYNESEDKGDPSYFSLPYKTLDDNPLDILVNDYYDTIPSLYSLMRFLAKTEPLGVPYYLASNKIKLAMMANEDDYPAPVIIYRHNHMYNTLDNEVMFDALLAIQNNSVVRIEFKSRINDQYLEDIEYEKDEEEIIPLECRHDYITGRQYLIALNKETNELESFRMDQVLTIEETGEQADITEAERESWKKKADSWTGSLNCIGEKHLIEIEFHYRDGEIPDTARLRLDREKENGTITHIDKTTDLFQIEVSDPMDLVPWIRSFGASAKVRKSDDPASERIRKRIIESWKEALEQYETV